MEGSAAETASSLFDLGISLLIGIVLVYSVMAIQFERYRQPFIILMAIPFVLIGSALALILFGSHLSIIAMLGIISLAGIAVNKRHHHGGLYQPAADQGQASPARGTDQRGLIENPGPY